MTRRPASLGRRLLLGASAVVVVAMTATGAMMYVALHHFVQGQVDGRLDGQIAAVEDALRAAPDGRLSLERVVDGPPFDRPLSGWYWAVLAPAPALRSHSLMGRDFSIGPPRDGPEHKPLTADGRGPPDEPLRVRLRAAQVDGITVTIAATAPREALTGPLREAMTPLAVTLALLAVLLLGGGLLQVWLGLRPLRLVRADLAAIRSGRAERIAGPQPAEIGPLVAELNGLLDGHAANLERARRNVANLAHSLKTPLATLALALDGPDAEQGARLKPLVATMDRMIRHHLARARAAALEGLARASVALEGRVADHERAFARLYAERSLAIEVEIPAGLAVACEAQDLDEMLGNLIDNACKWARRRVAVRATAQGLRVTLAVDDDGPGLTEADRAAMLRPGMRIDESAPGYGFGLPITRELAELYGGSLMLARSDLGGLRAVIDLPRAA